MSADTVAHNAKEEAAVAWKNGDFAGSIEHYTTAINHGNGDKEFLKVIFSNRSAAYLKVNQAEKALQDGQKCIELDQNWGKGYMRKGDALHAQRKYTDAYNAYNAGLRVVPNDASLKEKADQAIKMISSSSPSSSSSSSGGSGWGNTGSSANATASAVPANKYTLYMRYAVLGLFVLYMVPFLGSIGGLAYRASAAVHVALSVMEVFAKHGYPKFSSEYGMKIFPEPATLRVFLGAILIFSPRPYIFAIMPIIFNELIHFTPEIFQYVRNNADKLQAQAMPLLARFGVNIPPNMNIAAMFNSSMIPQANQMLLQLAATVEVSQGMFHIIELVLPSRNIIQLYLWWQYLKMRYMMDRVGHVKRAFGDMDQKITQLLAYQFVPAVVRQGYATVKTYLAKQAEMPTAGDASRSSGGSMFSKCTIM